MRTTTRCAIGFLFAFAIGPLWAMRQVGFQTDAFARAYPADFVQTALFSPASFEIDCALVAESLETIPKALVSERMGTLLGYESTFVPVLESLNCRTNGLTVLAARGFCVPDIKLAKSAFRHYLEDVYGAEIMRLFPPQGAENWFKATMEGEMEEFEIPVDVSRANRYAFYDLISVAAEFEEPFPTDASTLKFRPDPEGTNIVSVAAWSDVREVNLWETEEYTLLRLPLKSEAFLYLMLPKAGYDLAPAKQDIQSVEIDHLLRVTDSLTEKGVFKGPCAIQIPKLSLRGRTEFSQILTHFKIPTRGLVSVADQLPAREFVQMSRFRLVNRAGRSQSARVRTPETRTLVFDHPFLFFVHHEPTATILMAGQFFGR